jgi:hypothetical protein
MEGTIQVSTTNGQPTNSKLFQIRVGLLNNGNETTNGMTNERLVGSFNFGSGVLLISNHYKIMNATLADNPILNLQATNAP